MTPVMLEPAASWSQVKHSTTEPLRSLIIVKKYLFSPQYDSLRNSATTMKERYESRIKEMEEEKDSLEEQKEEMDQLVPKLREEIKKLQSQGGSGDQNVTNNSQSLLNEV